jgi:hypothetical protein
MAGVVRAVTDTKLSQRLQQLLKQQPQARTMIRTAFQGVDKPSWPHAGMTTSLLSADALIASTLAHSICFGGRVLCLHY